ncbi:hypothetical protein [Nostoc sp.]|uniref:hypothetical protein n=1 Tax=Nostoc sp. TaxID=1180 RepID=UPI003FA5B9F7
MRQFPKVCDLLTLLGDDMARRSWKNPQLFWLIALIPLFGPLIYLSVRPPLPEVGVDSMSQQPAGN